MAEHQGRYRSMLLFLHLNHEVVINIKYDDEEVADERPVSDTWRAYRRPCVGWTAAWSKGHHDGV